jgi:hypothetical protein
MQNSYDQQTLCNTTEENKRNISEDREAMTRLYENYIIILDEDNT